MENKKESYRIKSYLKHGAFGVVLLVERKSDKTKFAQKVINLSPFSKEEVDTFLEEA